MTLDELKSYIEQQYKDRLTLLESGKVEPLYEVTAESLVEVARALHDDSRLQLDFLCDAAVVDTTERFEVVYHLASVESKIRLDLKVVLPRENPAIDSVAQVWPAANWYEREAWELYGITIHNHDDLTRFLLPDDWDEGYPMRKDWDSPDFIRMPEM